MKCEARCGSFECTLEKDHDKHHNAGCGIYWEDVVQHHDAKIEQILVEGKVSHSLSIRTKVTLPDGRVFYSKCEYLDEEERPSECKCDVWKTGCKCNAK